MSASGQPREHFNPPEKPYAETKAFADARAVLGGKVISPPDALVLAKQLRSELAFAQAREIARIYRHRTTDDTLAFELLRVEVTSTYKDPELATEKGLRDAWQTIVDAGYKPDNLRTDTDEYRRRAPEVYGLAGAIKKRLWEYDGRVDHLQESLRYYKLGYGTDVATDAGYQAVNAAFALDLLASLEPHGAGGLDAAVAAAVRAKRVEADGIRSGLVTELSKVPVAQRSWWASASLGEALFGLRRYGEAVQVFRDALTTPRPDWEIESTIRQLATLARIQSKAANAQEPNASSPEWQALVDAFGSDLTSGVRSAFVGKIGLALSGGGFRAALYHIGVLASLAELDVLRHVEVLSCVSGGSIIGAYYYLELRHLLQTTRNDQIRQEEYLQLVARVEGRFLAGVQTNIRVQLLADTAASWANATDASFSQTARLGELFEEVLFQQVEDDVSEKRTPRWLSSLFIEPCRLPERGRDPQRPFAPRAENWKLPAKAPILIINATSLNTGHPWQFTAAHMGEPLGGIDPRVDANARLRRVRYVEAPEGHRRFRLGHAVAASAAVPSLFDPLSIEKLYAKPLMVRLADGGVYDNQGIAGLLEQGCTFLIVSDASGQSPLNADPPGHRLGVALTANDVLMARVRGLQFDVLSARIAARTLRGVAFVHLLQDIEGGTVNQRGSQVPTSPPTGDPLTPYGIRRDIQEQLARLRTDLDAFSDFEAYALMASGYHAMRHQLDQQQDLLRVLGGTRKLGTWMFTAVEPYITTTKRVDTDYAALCSLLANGRSVLMKTSDLYPDSRRRIVIGVKGALLVLVAVMAFFWSMTIAVLGVVAAASVVVAAAYVVLRWGRVAPSTDPVARKSFIQRTGALISLVGSGIAKRFLRRDNSRYLAFGCLSNEAFLTNSRRRWPT
jgi:predicted acylesterase/phospholipase RssA